MVIFLFVSIFGTYSLTVSINNQKIAEYQRGLNDGKLKDPTYSQALAFIQNDTTNTLAWRDDLNCYDLVRMLKTNAFNAGWKCFFVYIEFKTVAHGVVAFNTTDKGMIYFEPKNDREIEVRVGGRMFSDVILKVGLIP